MGIDIAYFESSGNYDGKQISFSCSAEGLNLYLARSQFEVFLNQKVC